MINTPLLLDDQGMNLLETLGEVYTDWQVALNNSSRYADAVEKVLEMRPLAFQFAAHICLLDENRDLRREAQLDWHITVNPTIVMLAHGLQAEDTPPVATRRVLEFVTLIMALYAPAKARQERKAAWLRDHPDSDP
jgi:hypothetical protein